MHIRLLSSLIFSMLFPLAGCKTDTKNVEACGDGFADTSEDCDGDDLGGQSCGSLGHYRLIGTLRCEADCSFDLTECGGRCGDGIVDAADGEACDGDALNGATCLTLGWAGGTLSCDAECRHDLTGCLSECGNGYVEGTETCDDGSTGDGDGCDATCAVEEGWTCAGTSPSRCSPVCGDNAALGDEACDGADLRQETCQILGYYGGSLACSDACALDLALCEAAGRCGDGVLQADEGEECEGDDPGDGTCRDLGFYSGTLTCDAGTCRLDAAGCEGRCGDGLIQLGEGEVCDQDQLNAATCESLGSYPGTLACDASCAFDLTQCGGTCGDGIIQSGFGEACDGDDLGGETCQSQGYSSGQLYCMSDCSLDTGACELMLLQLSAGGSHTCGVKADGSAWCWGENGNGQLGDGTTTDRHTPTAVSGLSSGVVEITAGGSHTCARLDSGSVRCWGANTYGQLGDSSITQRTVPIQVSSLTSGVSRVSAGGSHTCALKTDGSVWCWGYNFFGQLGSNSTSNYPVPHLVSSLSGVVGLTTGENHTCTVRTDGSALCWGFNSSGQLGNNSTLQSTIPVAVIGLTSEVSALTAGDSHTCALKTDGSVWCWGENNSGQLGDGSTTDRRVPTAITNTLAVTTTVAAGGSHTCAVEDDGDLFCWGENGSHQLADGSSTDSRYPIRLTSVPNDSLDVTAGGIHSCARVSGGTPWCWGGNTSGQVGVGYNSPFTSPSSVSF